MVIRNAPLAKAQERGVQHVKARGFIVVVAALRVIASSVAVLAHATIVTARVENNVNGVCPNRVTVVNV